jgi:carboxyl-terminal processing protease
VSISVSRREEPRREDIEITRRKLSLPQPKLDPPRNGVAVVRIPTFAPGSARALSAILDRMQKEKTRTALFDLRGNAWGELPEAARAAALLTGQGVLASLRDRQGGEKPVQAQAGEASWKGDLLLLTDAGTAYAAEAFVAALVDRGVAKQAGETTLGRGGEREYLPLGNGDYVALTVRKLFSPSGKTWHGTGLTPAVPVAQDPALPYKDRSDQQLQKAIDSMKEAFAGAKAA